jgi:hypothetical protein
MNYLVADGENSLRKVCVWWSPWVIKQSSWGFPSTCATTCSTDACSEYWAIPGFTECHYAEVGRNSWMSVRTFAITSTASRVFLLQLLGNTTSKVHRDDRPAWTEPLASCDWLKVWAALLFWVPEDFVCSTTAPWFRKCLVGHVYCCYSGWSSIVVRWVLESISRAPSSSWNHALQPMRVPGSRTRGR